MTLDIIIPTCKTLEEVALQAGAAVYTAGLHDVRMIVTCADDSAAVNRNLGLSRSTSDPLIMMDDDIEEFPHNWAADLLDIWRAHEDCVMLSPQLMNHADKDGEPAFMMGMDTLYHPNPPPETGLSVLPDQKLLTACIMIGRNELRFDEEFIGSGFEDEDYSDGLREMHPTGKWIVCHDVKVVHRNEQKNQIGKDRKIWEQNEAYYRQKKAARGS